MVEHSEVFSSKNDQWLGSISTGLSMNTWKIRKKKIWKITLHMLSCCCCCFVVVVVVQSLLFWTFNISFWKTMGSFSLKFFFSKNEQHSVSGFHFFWLTTSTIDEYLCRLILNDLSFLMLYMSFSKTMWNFASLSSTTIMTELFNCHLSVGFILVPQKQCKVLLF